jgi:hypothetical protein
LEARLPLQSHLSSLLTPLLSILIPFLYSNLAAGLKHVEGVLYGEKESPKKADLRAVPRPFLVFACKSVGMFHRFVPAFGIRFL